MTYMGITLVTHRPYWKGRNPFGKTFFIYKISERRFDVYDEDHWVDEVTTLDEANMWLSENTDQPW